ncbi:MAG: peptidoglycan DD-metalloendopeptidase family protein [Clostridiaceae bacterium]|nr:peptidoglycan DD-metalloendopeptidase family protein [Clostridiaceae bacterium]
MEGSKLKEAAARCRNKISSGIANTKNFVMNSSKKILSLGAGSSNKSIFARRIVDKRRFGITCGLIALVVLTIFIIMFSGRAYAVKVNGREICKVRNQKTVESALKALKQKYQENADSEISFTSEVTFEKSRASSKEILENDALIETLSRNINFNVQACRIYAEGNIIAALKTKEQAEALLKEIQDKSLAGKDKSNIKEIGFAEKVELKNEFVDSSEIAEKEEIIDFIIKGTNEIRTHKIESGESFWSISRRYNMTLEDLEKANLGVNSEKVKIGQVINLIVPKPLISVKTVETITAVVKAEFEQTVEFSSSMYKDETSIRVKGVYGEKEVVADVTKINGIETGRTVISEKIIKEPTTQIIIKGTKEPPPKKGTGTFSYPARGSISSRYGMRWGRRHTGIDIAAPYGSAVKASDGGVVTWVGYEGGYGKLIKIDHGANYVSYYGHLSKYNVKVGQKVYKGQKIGAVGNTGNSTGPHLHFEIRKNSVVQNPLKYLK